MENALGVDERLEYLATPDPSIPGWSETMFWNVWNPEAGVGLYIHTGTSPLDADLWWAQVFAYLPNDRAVADMSWGRRRENTGPQTGNFSAVCEQPLTRWRLRFDGAGSETDREEMAREMVGSGPAIPFSFDVSLNAVAPVWDLFKAVDLGERAWGSLHHEQNLTSTGTLRVNGQSWSLDGCAFRDHSRGPRDMSRGGGNHLLGVVFPKTGRSVQGLIMWNRAGAIELRAGSVYEEEELELVDEISTSGVEGDSDPRGLDDFQGAPNRFEVRIKRRNGTQLELQGEVLHSINVSLFDPNTNVNGSAIAHAAQNPLILTECPVRLAWPDGDVGYGFFERTYRVSLLKWADAS